MVFGEEQQQFMYSKQSFLKRKINPLKIDQWDPEMLISPKEVLCRPVCMCVCINNYMNRSSHRSVIQLIVRAYGDMVEQGRRR